MSDYIGGAPQAARDMMHQLSFRAGAAAEQPGPATEAELQEYVAATITALELEEPGFLAIFLEEAARSVARLAAMSSHAPDQAMAWAFNPEDGPPPPRVGLN